MRLKTCRSCGASSGDVEFAKGRRYCRECYLASHRGWMQKRRAMVGPEVEALAEAQGHRCAICQRKRKLVVDHCHTSDRFRALLCNACNTAIGLLDDDPRIIHSAARYVSGHHNEGREP